jgi:hypothetical protein
MERMRKFDPRCIIPVIGLLAGLLVIGSIVLPIVAVMFAPD